MTVAAGPVIVRTVDVDLDPDAAFSAFTEEIDEWYVRGRYSWNDPSRAVAIRFEPGVGGRWMEVWDSSTGEGYEIGRIRVWEPGSRFVTSYRNVFLPPEPPTEIEVRFDPIPGGTRVTLEHRGWERLPPGVFATWSGRAWNALIEAYRGYAAASAHREPT